MRKKLDRRFNSMDVIARARRLAERAGWPDMSGALWEALHRSKARIVSQHRPWWAVSRYEMGVDLREAIEDHVRDRTRHIDAVGDQIVEIPEELPLGRQVRVIVELVRAPELALWPEPWIDALVLLLASTLVAETYPADPDLVRELFLRYEQAVETAKVADKGSGDDAEE